MNYPDGTRYDSRAPWNEKSQYVRYCEYCGKPMTESEEEDFGSLCEKCYTKEYYRD